MNKIITLIISLCFSVSLHGQTNDQKLKIAHLSGDYYIFTTYRTYKGNSTSSNGMYLLTDKGVVMIDTPWDTTQFQPLLDSIEMKHHKKVVLCIATHSHEDRTGGLEFLKQKGISTYTSKQTYEMCKSNNERTAEYYFVKDTVFSVGQYTFQTYYGGEGHTKDNIVIWFPKDKILYGGCLIKSTEATDLGYIKEANLKAWPATLNNIKHTFSNPWFIITGHQSFTSLKSIDHTLDLLKQNEN